MPYLYDERVPGEIYARGAFARVHAPRARVHASHAPCALDDVVPAAVNVAGDGAAGDVGDGEASPGVPMSTRVAEQGMKGMEPGEPVHAGLGHGLPGADFPVQLARCPFVEFPVRLVRRLFAAFLARLAHYWLESVQSPRLPVGQSLQALMSDIRRSGGRDNATFAGRTLHLISVPHPECARKCRRNAHFQEMWRRNSRSIAWSSPPETGKSR